MMKRQFSVILLPTLHCNAACDYCFENKTRDYLTLDRLAELIRKLLDYMAENAIDTLTLHWQGGEIMTLPPHWFEQAYAIIRQAAENRGKVIRHGLQSNMIGYSAKWNRVIAEMFGNCVSTSMDYPNLHRRIAGHDPAHYSALWSRKVQAARANGIDIGVIAVANRQTLALGAERFYSHFVDELQITDFQINTPFPGGEANAAKTGIELSNEELSRFFIDLSTLWLERGYYNGVKIGPFNELIDYFNSGSGCLPCIWGENCSNEFISIDARGHVAQCDCWVASYPDYRYGNLFEYDRLSELLKSSPVRRRFNERPIALMQRDCIDCTYLALCHGGCPVRAYTALGELFEKDPYCGFYRALFNHLESVAATVARTAALES